MQTFKLGDILERPLLYAIYKAKRLNYGKPLNEALSGFKNDNLNDLRLNIIQLIILVDALILSLRIKNKQKGGRILRDKSFLMLAYLKLFSFTNKIKKNGGIFYG